MVSLFVKVLALKKPGSAGLFFKKTEGSFEIK